VAGIFVKLPSTQVLDVIAASSFDFVVIDLEHSQLSESDALALVRHARLLDLPALVRVTVVERGLVNRLLEAGASGIQLSTVRSVEQVRALVAATRYAPQGSRSIGVAHPDAEYGARPLADYVEDTRQDQPLVVAQIETAQTDDPLADILAAGVDVAFVGTTDLAVDLGHDADRVAARGAEIAVAAAQAGVTLGGASFRHPDVLVAADHADLGLLRGACDVAAPGPAAPDRPAAAAERGSRTIEQLMADWSYRLDVEGGGRVHELFTPHGAYVIDGRALTGRDAIRDGYVARANQGPRTSRHLFTNTRIEPLSSGRARVDSVLTVYAEDGEPVHRAGAPLVIADVTDLCVRDGDGSWSFERRELRTLFQGDGTPRPPAGAR
jgi:4-hydroxy-2-oxoheptanedioate aldolase